MLQEIKILKLEGILGGTKASEFRKQVSKLIEEGKKIVLLDLNQVTFMDSSGLGALVLAFKNLQAHDGRLFLMSINEQIKMLFDLTNMGQIFEVVTDETEVEEILRSS